MVTIVPLSAILFIFAIRKNFQDAISASLAVTLALPLNGVITDLIKLSVGRPRPDFMLRCWPDGNVPENALGKAHLECPGSYDAVVEGRKSFPSGHSSFSFAAFGFVFFYLSGKLKPFSIATRGKVGPARLLIPLLFLISK
jgi:diacylglycerol diphosphate phosphatase/phosphatidate phosphatase